MLPRHPKTKEILDFQFPLFKNVGGVTSLWANMIKVLFNILKSQSPLGFKFEVSRALVSKDFMKILAIGGISLECLKLVYRIVL